MNVKTTIELPEHLLRLAERLVEEGQYPSVDKVVAAGLDELMRTADQLTPEQDRLVASLADTIRERAALPEDQFIDMETDNLFDRVKRRLAQTHEQS
ncbi:hypothetical protein [Rhizobium sp. SAFR-030]|uniref:hypothetical protein n=1 Tax=Rhizobium sp. SAFR-030 TaxID=3387277 RepID=UPI003F7EB5DD